MTTEQPSAAPASPSLFWSAAFGGRDVLGDALKLVFLVVSAGLAGKAGLSEPLQALLAAPQVPSVLIAMFGFWLLVRLLVGTFVTAHNGDLLGQQWASFWEPIRLVLLSALLIPFAGQGLLIAALQWATNVGAGL